MTVRALEGAGKDFEIIVVDDNSPDGTQEVAKKLQAREFLFFIIIKQNFILFSPDGTHEVAKKLQARFFLLFPCFFRCFCCLSDSILVFETLKP